MLLRGGRRDWVAAELPLVLDVVEVAGVFELVCADAVGDGVDDIFPQN